MNIIKRLKMYCTLTGVSVAEIHARTGLSRQTDHLQDLADGSLHNRDT